ncbi:MAG: carbohydrate porin [Caulobacter sp.]|nr:carbohydrate porin [Caulobacter sp.]
MSSLCKRTSPGRLNAGPVRALVLAAILGAAPAAVAAAEDGPDPEPAVQFSLSYTADVSGVVDGGLSRRGRFLDDLQLAADIDLEKAMGWEGATFHGLLLNNSGAMPNDAAGTLQGVDNIEVSRQRTRLYEAWVEQTLADGRASLLIGLYDLNSEFYANDSAGLLIAPAFGIGSELAATGANGPSIFPSTALTLRGRVTMGETGYLQAAVVNANAGVLGDPSGVNLDFDGGALLIAEAGMGGMGGKGRLAGGVWRYTDRQDDWRDTTAAGTPVQQVSQGAYLLLEQPLMGDADGPRQVTGFARIGVSDGDTSPFHGGWQAGLLIERVLDGRPDSQLSFGVNQAWINSRERANGADAGRDIGSTETALEITYADRVTPHLTIQPDLQYVIRPSGDRDIDNALVATVRLRWEY